jgi:hypothetical protein
VVDTKIVLRCNHCGFPASFILLSTCGYKEYDWLVIGISKVKVVINTTWQFLECQTCSRPTVLMKSEWCEVYDDGNEGLSRPIPGWPKHGDEVNCEDIGDEIVYPLYIPPDLPIPDMPEEIARDFNEARSVFAISPRASAALLRLVIEKLCIHLEQKGKTLDAAIATLVAEKRLPVLVQQALDSVRVIGNNAVHPGQLDLRDDAKTSEKLFNLVNFIVRETITRPSEIAVLYNNNLSEEQQKKISDRQEKEEKKRSKDSFM